MTDIYTFRLSFAEPFLPSLPSSPSIPRRNAYAIRAAAGWRITAGRRCIWRSHIDRAHVLRAFGVGRSSANGIARTAVKISRSCPSE